MTLTEFYYCYIPKMLGNARKKITSPTSFKELSKEEMLALALWADLDVDVDETTEIDDHGNTIKEFAGARVRGSIQVSIEDGRFTVMEKNPKQEQETNDY